MSIVASYTREQWYANGEWAGVEPEVDGVCLLFRVEDYEEDDVLPVVVRVDPDTGKPWPEDAGELPDVPFRYFKRYGKTWAFESEGADQSAHRRILLRRKQWIKRSTRHLTI